MSEPTRLQRAIRKIDADDERERELDEPAGHEPAIEAVTAAILGTVDADAELDEAIEGMSRQIARQAIRRVRDRLNALERG